MVSGHCSPADRHSQSRKSSATSQRNVRDGRGAQNGTLPRNSGLGGRPSGVNHAIHVTPCLPSSSTDRVTTTKIFRVHPETPSPDSRPERGLLPRDQGSRVVPGCLIKECKCGSNALHVISRPVGSTSHTYPYECPC